MVELLSRTVLGFLFIIHYNFDHKMWITKYISFLSKHVHEKYMFLIFITCSSLFK